MESVGRVTRSRAKAAASGTPIQPEAKASTCTRATRSTRKSNVDATRTLLFKEGRLTEDDLDQDAPSHTSAAPQSEDPSTSTMDQTSKAAVTAATVPPPEPSFVEAHQSPVAVPSMVATETSPVAPTLSVSGDASLVTPSVQFAVPHAQTPTATPASMDKTTPTTVDGVLSPPIIVAAPSEPSTTTPQAQPQVDVQAAFGFQQLDTVETSPVMLAVTPMDTLPDAMLAVPPAPAAPSPAPSPTGPIEASAADSLQYSVSQTPPVLSTCPPGEEPMHDVMPSDSVPAPPAIEVPLDPASGVSDMLSPPGVASAIPGGLQAQPKPSPRKAAGGRMLQGFMSPAVNKPVPVDGVKAPMSVSKPSRLSARLAAAATADGDAAMPEAAAPTVPMEAAEVPVTTLDVQPTAPGTPLPLGTPGNAGAERVMTPAVEDAGVESSTHWMSASSDGAPTATAAVATPALSRPESVQRQALEDRAAAFMDTCAPVDTPHPASGRVLGAVVGLPASDAALALHSSVSKRVSISTPQPEHGADSGRHDHSTAPGSATKSLSGKMFVRTPHPKSARGGAMAVDDACDDVCAEEAVEASDLAMGDVSRRSSVMRQFDAGELQAGGDDGEEADAACSNVSDPGEDVTGSADEGADQHMDGVVGMDDEERLDVEDDVSSLASEDRQVDMQAAMEVDGPAVEQHLAPAVGEDIAGEAAVAHHPVDDGADAAAPQQSGDAPMQSVRSSTKYQRAAEQLLAYQRDQENISSRANVSQPQPRLKGKVVIPDGSSFDARSLASLRRELKEKTKAKTVDLLEVRHPKLISKAPPARTNSLVSEEREDGDEEAEYDEDAENELVAAMTGGKMDIGPATTAPAPLRGLPLPQGQHTRFEDDGEAVPSPGRIMLRGVVPATGTHTRFD